MKDALLFIVETGRFPYAQCLAIHEGWALPQEPEENRRKGFSLECFTLTVLLEKPLPVASSARAFLLRLSPGVRLE